jgi:hypothetical protein
MIFPAISFSIVLELWITLYKSNLKALLTLQLLHFVRFLLQLTQTPLPTRNGTYSAS